jgi:hypothetical protein
MNNLVCPKCKGEIRLGIAICPVEEYGARYFGPQPPITHKTMNIIDVYKCKSCGYSCDDHYNLLEINE